MARLHEYQGKAILAAGGIAVPRGCAAASPAEAGAVAEELAGPVVVKIQAFTTGRAAIGGIAFADSPAQAEEHARRMLGMQVGQFVVDRVLVEERLSLAAELFMSLSVDERERAPVLLLAAVGGSGVESRAAAVRRVPCDVRAGPDDAGLRAAVAALPLSESLRGQVASTARKVLDIVRSMDARSLEINPLAVTAAGSLVAADCRITIDDYAVFRHPDLGIDVVRELDHPPTSLERIAYAVEQADHRGTFYFAQLATSPAPGSRGLVGFHGAGGGGSMMAMDAITDEGFTVANFTDTSGNPSAAKVYRAARIILAQPSLVGYFGSGSGVASQEQFWSAYGLAKAFWEVNLDIPAVIRLGGNSEDRAVDILQTGCRGLPATVEGYKKTDAPAFIAGRFAELVERGDGRAWSPRPRRAPAFVGARDTVQFSINGGRVWIDASRWSGTRAAVLAHSAGLIRDEHGSPALTVSDAEFARKDSEMIACEVECRRAGLEGFFIELDIPGLDGTGPSRAATQAPPTVGAARAER